MPPATERHFMKRIEAKVTEAAMMDPHWGDTSSKTIFASRTSDSMAVASMPDTFKLVFCGKVCPNKPTNSKLKH